MHTLAALSQTFHEHLLAYVKQILPRAKPHAPITVLLAIALSASACATLPRSGGYVTKLTAPVTQSAPLINLNTASAEELEKLPGIGKGISERIIAHREQYGPFRRPEHLMMVRGISDRKFRELRPMTTVE